jgi:flagellar protein FliJ
MKRFKFRLKSLLEMKERKEKELGRDLAKKNYERALVANQLQECRDLFSEFQESEKQKRGGALDPLLLKTSVSYRYRLQQDIDDKIRRGAVLQKEIAVLTQSLIDAKKETRALEIIMEKKREQWKKAYQQAERKFIDEISQKRPIQNPLEEDRAAVSLL